jgi:diacylglycerol O-acyltransferase
MTPWFERLTTLDALFLNLENDRNAHMHVGAVALFDGPAPPYRDLLALIESKLAQVPRYRQRLMFVPFGQGRPVWIDETQFDLEFHVRHTALPSPGGLDELEKLAGRLFSQRLDRDKPLWELWLVEGLKDGGFAIISKTHHCMIDGVAGIDLAAVLMEMDAERIEPEPAAPWTPRPAPKASELLTKSVADQISHPLRFVRDAIQSAQSEHSEPRQILKELAAGVLPMLEFASHGQAPACSLNVPIGPHRRFSMTTFSLSEVKSVRANLGGTVNDVVLATVAGALRDYLLKRGDSIGPDLRAMVPVSMRAPDGHGQMGNQVSAIFCSLPVGDADPASRLKKIRDEMKGVKESGQAMGAHALTRLSDFAPPGLLAQAARLQSVTRFFNLVVTNVPGPQFPLYLLGRKMRACHPQIPLAATQAIVVGLLSYDGNICIGLTGDADAAKDLEELSRALRGALDDLLSAAGQPISLDASSQLGELIETIELHTDDLAPNHPAPIERH